MTEFVSNKELESLLRKSKPEEIKGLRIIAYGNNLTDSESKSTSKQLCRTLFGKLGYMNALTQVAKKLEVSEEYIKLQTIKEQDDLNSEMAMKPRKRNEWKTSRNLYIERLEKAVLQKVLSLSYEKASKEEKEKLDQKVREIASNHGKSVKGIAGTAGLLTAANMGGFSTYMLMSSLLSTISFGTLGFGAYTAASSILSAIIGPAGWIGLGVYGLYKLGQPNFKKLIPAVVAIAMIRQRVKYEEEQARLEVLARIERYKQRQHSEAANRGQHKSSKKPEVILAVVLSVFVLLIAFSDFG